MGQPAAHMFAMRLTNLRARDEFSKRTGKILFEEEQKTTTESMQGSNSSTIVKRHYDVMPPEYFGSLNDREFILFHGKGISPGYVMNVDSNNETI